MGCMFSLQYYMIRQVIVNYMELIFSTLVWLNSSAVVHECNHELIFVIVVVVVVVVVVVTTATSAAVLFNMSHHPHYYTHAR